MQDRNGVNIEVGAEVWVYRSRRGTKPAWARCFVRKLDPVDPNSPTTKHKAKDRVLVDNGDRPNPDLNTNRFTFSGWVEPDYLQVRPEKSA